MGSGGYHSGRQPDDLPVEIGGSGSSGLQEENKGTGGPFEAPESLENAKANGDTPSFSMPPFADGPEVRKTYQRPQGE